MEMTFLPLAMNQAFSYDLYTYREHRGRGIATLLKALVYQRLEEIGIKETFSLVSPDNKPSLRLRVLLGEQPERMVYGYRIRNWQKTFLGPTRDVWLQQWWEQYKQHLAQHEA